MGAPICNYIRLTSVILGMPESQIAKRIGVVLPTPAVKGHPCMGCGVIIPRGNRNLYCDECRLIPITCEVCGRIRYVRRVVALRQNDTSGHPRFCSKKCHGTWLAEHYGFAFHPPRTGHKGPPRKYDYARLYEEWLASKLSRWSFGESRRIPAGSLYQTLKSGKKEYEARG